MASAVLGAAVAALAGGLLGPVLGGCVGLGMWRWLDTLSSRAEQARHAHIVAWSPLVADLLADLVVAGLPPDVAVRRLAAVGEHPLQDVLREVGRRLELGEDPARACRDSLDDEATRPLGRALSRSLSRGTSPVEVLNQFATSSRVDQQSGAESRARRLGTFAALPLGLTMLPAFVLVAVVPLVLGGLSRALDVSVG